MGDLLTDALSYAARGWHIFPVRGKLPALDLAPRWSRDSTTDPEQIVAWLAGSQGLGIAVDLEKSGLCVVDGDRLELLLFSATLDGWPYRGNRTRRSWLYSINGHPIPQARHPWGEVKSAGGYVVLPPSPHESGVEYEWLTELGDGPPPLLPFDVEALIAPARRDAPDGQPWDGATGDPEQVWQAEQRAEAQAQAVASAGRGRRNAALNSAALILGHYCPHYLNPDIVTLLLMRAAEECGLWRDDGKGACYATVRSGLAAGMAEPQQLHRGPTLLDVDEADLVSVEDRVFGYSPELELIRHAARARLVSPWAVLGCTLALTLAELPPHYCLPPLVGGVASLNYATAITGPSGTAKSTAYKVARELLGVNLEARRIGPGSGEGLLQTFLAWDKDTKQLRLRPAHECRAILYADEIGQIGQLSKRLGSTHAPLLRSALTGGDLFTTNADQARNRHVPDGEYRLTMVVGVQPALAGVLLDDTDAGGPQRFLWLPSQDTQVPDDAPEWDGRGLTWALPVDEGTRRDMRGRVLLGMPPHVTKLAQEALRTRHRAGLDATDTESHSLLTHMKTAAALAALHRRLDATDADWRLAEELMRLSATLQRHCRDIADRKTAASLEGRVAAQRKAANSAAGREAEDDARAIYRIVDRHAQGGAPDRHRGEYAGCPRGCVTAGVKRLRGQAERLTAAMEYGEAADWLDVGEGGQARPSGRSRPDDA